MEEGKKISFGFSKLTKKPNLVPKPPPARRDKIQLIDCLESQTIKLKNAVKETKGPLIIPLPESSGNILERRRESKIAREIKSEDNIDDRPDSELTADELAARELIRDAQNLNGKSESGKLYALPIDTENSLAIEGKAESTIENYEAVPINEYGMAMLRGMGWKEGVAIGKTTKIAAKTKEPSLRPRGLGLGADKGANQKDVHKPAVDKDGKELILKKGAYAKVVEGKQKGNYCEVDILEANANVIASVQGFDENGRIIVKMTLQGLILSINELFVRPVTKEEYAKSSKVINNAKYEEYKNKTEIKEEPAIIVPEPNSYKKESNSNRNASSSSRHQTISISSEDSDSKHRSRQKTNRNEREGDGHKYKKKSKSKHRSPSSSSTASESDRRRHKERTQRSSSLSDYEHKKYKSKSKKKSKDKKDDRHRSDPDSDYSHSKHSHKKYKHKKHQGRS